MLTLDELKKLRDRAYHWWEWAAGIRGASELEASGLKVDDLFLLLDTSEIVEYARPSSLLRGYYPTRLDLSLNLVFAKDKLVHMSGPHAKEIQGVARGWHEHMSNAIAELRSMRERLDRKRLSEINQDLQRIQEGGIRSQADELLRLLRENYRWLFTDTETRIRRPEVFDSLLLRLRVPSRADLGIPAAPKYAPRQDRISWWAERLDRTEYGKQEPLANYVDALALDQIEQVAAAEGSKTPILLTHSKKIFEALRVARETESPAFFRRQGLSLVQPPQMMLVLRLYQDAEDPRRIEQLTEELTRQQARGEEVYELLSRIVATKNATHPSIDSSVEKDIAEFEESWRQWDALRQVLQTLQQSDDTPGMLANLEKILHEADPEDAEIFQERLLQELDRLIADLDRLQAEIASRIAPPRPPTELDLQPDDAEKLSQGVLRLRSEPRIRSAVYPMGAYRFSDPDVTTRLRDIAAELENLKAKVNEGETRGRLDRLMNEARQQMEKTPRPELFLLFAVFYLMQEKWMQAYDMATRGLTLTDVSQRGVQESSARAELLLVRASARRAFVHALRMDFPNECKEFLQGAVDDCLDALDEQRRVREGPPDRRCLRELAVTFCASQDPVYGPRGAGVDTLPIPLTIDAARLSHGIAVDAKSDPLLLAKGFALQAYEQPTRDPHAKALFANTLLYIMTEIDRRLMAAKHAPLYEEKRMRLAGELPAGNDDPNLLDTLMWHAYVLATARKRRNDESWRQFDQKAKELATTLAAHPGLSGNTNQYYHRLVTFHRECVTADVLS